MYVRSMAKLTKGQVLFNGLIHEIVKLIVRWEPGVLKKEIYYRNSLLDFLRNSLPDDCRVESEYRHLQRFSFVWTGITAMAKPSTNIISGDLAHRLR